MTPELLKQARDSAQALIDRWDSPHWKEAEHTGVFIARLREVVSALDAHAALSDYDKAVHALAIYLGEGEYIYWSGALRRYSQDLTYLTTISSLEIPPPPEGDNGARRITHNSDGTVTVERG